MAILETILLGAAGSAVYGLTREAAGAAVSYLTKNRPDMVARIEAARDEATLRNEISGALRVAAADGKVAISNAFIEAIRLATFDHQHGVINIGGTKISAPVLVTGGGAGATGQTAIGGGTVLKSHGTAIHIGQGAAIVMTGGASIKQN